MKYGFVLPGAAPTEMLAQAELADAAGWDGVFVWEAAYGPEPWSLLSAMAQRTTRVHLGTMLTPLPWRRPWKLASQVATLDQLSGGRAILAVGLGAVDPELGSIPEVTDRRTRAELLDEGIDLIQGFWTGNLEFVGRHHQIDLRVREDFAQLVKPIQQPGIPIWVVGAWPRPKSMERVLRCQGILPCYIDESGMRAMTTDDMVAMISWLREHAVATGFDVVTDGETPTDDPTKASEIVRPWAEVGCTWWLETRWQETLEDTEERRRLVRERLAAGPPRA